jgi:hypothetical protein
VKFVNSEVIGKPIYFTQAFQINAGRVPDSGPDTFLPNPLTVIT